MSQDYVQGYRHKSSDSLMPVMPAGQNKFIPCAPTNHSKPVIGAMPKLTGTQSSRLEQLAKQIPSRFYTPTVRNRRHSV